MAFPPENADSGNPSKDSGRRGPYLPSEFQAYPLPAVHYSHGICRKNHYLSASRPYLDEEF
ncbi:MAG: hypothetical protein A2X86_16710 [Bdellovibrionales bacterium GWA2_49_15]|nr:MAG: hypothetical protein A2X86_16710 [Bdellovibrionales bacterium GWA2_49_15]HAZ12484.1 hypothetical protein [Bdellovibrionales bacterium]